MATNYVPSTVPSVTGLRYPLDNQTVIVLCSEHLRELESIGELPDTLEKMGFELKHCRHTKNKTAATTIVNLLNDPMFQIKQLDLKFVLYKDYWNHSMFDDLRLAIYSYKKAIGQDTQPFIDALKKTYRGEYSGMSFVFGNKIEIIELLSRKKSSHET